MDVHLDNRVAVITGAGRGMGKAIARALAASGARVVLGARTMSHGEQTLAEFQAAGYTVALQQCDVSRQEDCVNLVQFAVSKFGGLDILVHCAADIPHGVIRKLPDEDFERSMHSVLFAGFWLARAAIPQLVQSGQGRMVFISSVAGSKTTIPGMAHYGAAKAGLDALARGLAAELGAEGVTVNTINPGLISSDRMLANLAPEHQRAVSATIPIARPGTMEEVADLVVYLASSKGAYITGESVVIDGGSSLGSSDVSSRVKE